VRPGRERVQIRRARLVVVVVFHLEPHVETSEKKYGGMNGLAIKVAKSDEYLWRRITRLLLYLSLDFSVRRSERQPVRQA
jgi:hypothetical protein